MSNEIFAEMTRDVLQSFAGQSGEVSLHLADGIISGSAYIHLESITVGDEQGAVESQWLAHIDMNHGRTLRRGDEIRNSGGKAWLLAERIDDDETRELWALELK